MLIEDLGDALYADVLGRRGDAHELYGAAIDALARLHREAAPALLPPDKPLHVYDDTALIAETDLMTEWFVPLALGRDATPEESERTARAGARCWVRWAGAAPVFVHRDYHAQNLLWLPSARASPASA